LAEYVFVIAHEIAMRSCRERSMSTASLDRVIPWQRRLEILALVNDFEPKLQNVALESRHELPTNEYESIFTCGDKRPDVGTFVRWRTVDRYNVSVGH